MEAGRTPAAEDHGARGRRRAVDLTRTRRSSAVLLALLVCPAVAFAEGPTTQDEYVLGRDLYLSLSAENVPAAIEHLRRAVEIDPTNLRAWYTLSDAYRTGQLMVRTDADALEKGSREVDDHLLRLAVDPQLAPGYDRTLLANLSARLKGKVAIDQANWTEAEALLKRDEVLASDSELNKGRDISYGTFLFSVGRVEDAERFLERARRADRYAAVIYSHLARVHAALGDRERSFAVLDEGMSLFPGSDTGIEPRWHPLLRKTALLTALATGDVDLIAAKARSIKDADLGTGALDKTLAALLGDDRALRRTLQAMWSDPVNRYGYRAESIAFWAAYAGDRDLAITALHHLPHDLAASALWHPVMSGLRDHPGFRAIVQETGLLAYWRARGDWGAFCGPVGTDEFRCTVGPNSALAQPRAGRRGP